MSSGASTAAAPAGGGPPAASFSRRRRSNSQQQQQQQQQQEQEQHHPPSPSPEQPFEPSEHAFLKLWFARNTGAGGLRGRQALQPGVIPALAKKGDEDDEDQNSPVAAGRRQQPPRRTPVTDPVIGQRVYYQVENRQGVITGVDHRHSCVEVQMDGDEEDSPYELEYGSLVYA